MSSHAPLGTRTPGPIVPDSPRMNTKLSKDWIPSKQYIWIQFVPHRKHITSQLQYPTGYWCMGKESLFIVRTIWNIAWVERWVLVRQSGLYIQQLQDFTFKKHGISGRQSGRIQEGSGRRQSHGQINLTRLSGPSSRQTATQKIWQRRESNPGTLAIKPQRRSISFPLFLKCSHSLSVSHYLPILLSSCLFTRNKNGNREEVRLCLGFQNCSVPISAETLAILRLLTASLRKIDFSINLILPATLRPWGRLT
jgi:hypothetical protein